LNEKGLPKQPPFLVAAVGQWRYRTIPRGWNALMKLLSDSDFRARRFMLERRDFALAKGRYSEPADLIPKATWRSIVGLPDDVSIRTSDRFGTELEKLWDYWGISVRVVLGVQALVADPSQSPAAIATSDASDEFQAATYCALVGYYRVAFSCLRNILEQCTIATQLELAGDAQGVVDWRNGEERIKFGWAADMLPRHATVSDLEQHLDNTVEDSLFRQVPRGFARRLFVNLSKYTHGAAGFTDADLRDSNGPIFVPKAFMDWCGAALKTYAVVLHEVKLAMPQLKGLPYGPPTMTLDEFRAQIVSEIPTADADQPLLRAVADFWS
jgi:hypothetical protein